MVKKTFLFISVILMLSCNKHYFFSKDNGNIVFKNFNDTIVDVSHCNFQSFEKINVKSFNLEDTDIKNYAKRFDKNAYSTLFTIQEDAFNEFYRKRCNDGESYIGDTKQDTTNNRVVLAPFGRISLSDGIESYIVLMYSPNGSGEYNKYLIMYNVKQNKLCSVVDLVFLVYSNEGAYNSKSNILKNNAIVQIKHPGCFDIPYETMKYLQLDYNLYDEKKFESYTFSTYNIDKNGYVRLVN